MVAKGSFSKLLTPVAPREVASLYQEITGSSSPAEETVAVRPQYLQAAEKRAVRMGISPEQLLGEYSRRLKESTYPTPSCLTTDAVQAYSSGAELTEEQKDHVASCEPCSRLVEASRPSEEILASLMENVRLLAVKAVAASAGTPGASPSSREAAKLFTSSAQVATQWAGAVSLNSNKR
jgi:hypothetical protein